MIANKIIPAIKEKMPSELRGQRIVIQQDNAKPHAKGDDITITSAATSDGWDIAMKNQPANSPDFNYLDLGFFKAIQSLQHQMAPANIDELIKCVEDAYWQQPIETVENVCLSLQQCLQCCMLVKGCNRYKLPHMAKKKMRATLRKTGEPMPTVIPCSEEALTSAMGVL